MLNSVYKSIEGYENLYWISPKGDVHNGRKSLKPYRNNNGYAAIILSKGGKRKHFLVHRLVAATFLHNPLKKTEVNHIDGNKLNNNVCNLEWVTSSENKAHAKDNKLWEYSKPTLGVNKGKTSKYHNVTWDKNRQKWIGSVRHNGKTLGQKRFEFEDDAALHVNGLLDALNLQDRPRNVIN